MADTDQYRYFYLRDQAHGRCVVAGDRYEGPNRTTLLMFNSARPNVYHQEPHGRENAQWKFVATDGGWFHIVDRLHRGLLVAGGDGQVYHVKLPEGADLAGGVVGDEAQWKLETVTPGVVCLIDRKHGRALVAGDVYDGNLYHQVPGTRRNANWLLELSQPGDIGPSAFIVDEALVDGPHFDGTNAIRFDLPPLLVIADQVVRNLTSTDQEVTLTQSVADRTAETVTTQMSVSVSVLLGLEFEIGSDKLVGFKLKTEESLKYALTHSKAVSRDVTRTLELVIPIKVPAGKAVTVNARLSRRTADIPFTFTVRRTLGDGTTSDTEVHGVWRGVEYVEDQVTYTTAPAVRAVGAATAPTV